MALALAFQLSLLGNKKKKIEEVTSKNHSGCLPAVLAVLTTSDFRKEKEEVTLSASYGHQHSSSSESISNQ